LRELPDRCVQACITSPPYWGLRDYGVDGQIGLEKTPEEYCEKMASVFREVHRVLRDDGTLWLNLGDCYASAWACNRRNMIGQDSPKPIERSKRIPRGKGRWGGGNNGVEGLKEKDLVGIPWRVAFALQSDGWYLRSDIIWSKPNPMPESVKDRPTRAHEYVFLMSKSARYYYDAEAIRESATYAGPNGSQHSPYSQGFTRRSPEQERARQDKQRGHGRRHAGFNDRWDKMSKEEQGALGRNKRTVWEIATQPYPEAHFATFPEAVAQPCIMAGTSEKGACSKCGAPWTREVISKLVKSPVHGAGSVVGRRKKSGQNNFDGAGMPRMNRETKTVGWRPPCSCGAGTVPCLVLDPFIGSGTTAVVARQLGRNYVGIELNPEYATLAISRIRAGKVPKRRAIPDKAQSELFDEP
jgi:DNA modification methylase